MIGLNNTCSACLCTNRKMFILSEINKKQCYLEIISGYVPSTKLEEQLIMLCWECNALLKKFANFKHLVQESFKIFNGIHQTKKSHRESRLSIKNEYLFCVTNTNDEDTKCEIIPSLPSIDIQVKIEENYFSDNNIANTPTRSSSSDDEAVPKKVNDPKRLLKIKKMKRRKLILQTSFLKKQKKKIKIRKCLKDAAENAVYTEIELTKQEIEDERRALGEKEEYRNAVFRCENCVQPFCNKDDLMDHYLIKHDPAAPHHCSICNCSFNFDQAYKYHKSKHTKRYRCIVCLTIHRNKRAVLKHYHIEHAPLTQDPEVHEGNTEETAHKTEENGEQTSYPCGSCEKTFKYKTSLRKHLEAHSIESGAKRQPYCEPCRMSFKSTANLQKHVKTSFKHKVQLKMRRLKESNGETEAPLIDKIRAGIARSLHMHACDVCGRTFQWRGNLLRHVQSHVARAKGELVCEPCNRSFSSVATYQQHMKISKKHVLESDYKYMCSDCGKKFANKIRLKDHINYEHLKNFTHTCVECHKIFKSHTSLYMHNQIVHEKGVAEKLCDHCGKHFPNASKLSKHIKVIHLGEMSYSCTVCGAKFGWSSSLNRHTHKVHPRGDAKSELRGDSGTQGRSGDG